jgi:hypothetical protein
MVALRCKVSTFPAHAAARISPGGVDVTGMAGDGAPVNPGRESETESE